MEISVLRPASNGMIEVRVDYYEQVDGLGHSGAINVWVPETDSRKPTWAYAVAPGAP